MGSLGPTELNRGPFSAAVRNRIGIVVAAEHDDIPRRKLGVIAFVDGAHSNVPFLPHDYCIVEFLETC